MTSQRANRPRLLLVGPLPPPAGGTTVLFAALAHWLSTTGDFAVDVVGTGGVRGAGISGLPAFGKLVAEIWSGTRRADLVALHLSTTGMHVIGPVVAAAARLFSTPFIVRKFGGTGVSDTSSVKRAVSLWALRTADAYLVETRFLVEQETRLGLRNVRWYPNSRSMPDLTEDQQEAAARCARFVFLGQIRSEKGVRVLAEAARTLPAGVTVDLYGLGGFDVSISDLSGISQLSYRGAVAPAEVHDLLLSYDALVLPTHYQGEGYPGVILEAYAAGLPVLATRWRAIPEIVDDTTGVLVEPRDADGLRAAMVELHQNVDLYRRLRQGARARRDDFSEERWQDEFADLCRELMG